MVTFLNTSQLQTGCLYTCNWANYGHEVGELSLYLTNQALRHEDVCSRGYIDAGILDLDTMYLEVSGHIQAQAALPPEVGPRTNLDDMERSTIFPLLGLRPMPSVVQSVTSRYTDWAIPASTMLILVELVSQAP
jgi:hypothetical protein